MNAAVDAGAHVPSVPARARIVMLRLCTFIVSADKEFDIQERIRKKRMRLIQISTLAVAACILSACGGLSAKQQSATSEAITALRKLEAASQVKPSLMHYNQLVIEAKAQVNEAAMVLPDGELKQELNAAIEAYADAATAWAAMQRTYLRDDKEPGKTLGPKYGLHLDSANAGMREYFEGVERIGNPNYESPTTKGVLGKIWSVGKGHLDRAAKIVR